MSPRSKVAVCALALLAGSALADRFLGPALYSGGVYEGRPLPPFGRLAQPQLAEWLAAERECEARGQRSGSSVAFDPELGWSNHAGWSRGGRVGALGARGPREYARDKPQEVRRVLCFGDSYTYGSEVLDDEAWPAQLEARAPGFEALNFGVAAYGTDQALLRFRDVGRGLGADALVVGLHLWSIGRNVNRSRPLLQPAMEPVLVKPRFVLEGGELRLVPIPFRAFSELVEAVARDELVERLAEHEFWSHDDPWFAGSTIARFAAAESAYERREPRRMWLELDGEPFRVTVALLEAFRREALAAGIPRVAVLVTGFRSDLADLRASGRPYWQGLLDVLAARGIECIDAASAMAETAAERELFLDTHLNAEGNAIVARLVGEWLLGQD